MLRKITLSFAAALALAACDTEEEPFRFEEMGYKGTMTVQSLTSEAQYTYPDKNFDLGQDSKNGIALWMYDTQFVPMMPKMTMVVPGIEAKAEGDLFTLSGNKIVPYYRDGDDMLPMDESRTITDFTGTVDKEAGTLAVTFVCMGFQVEYTGNAIK